MRETESEPEPVDTEEFDTIGEPREPELEVPGGSVPVEEDENE